MKNNEIAIFNYLLEYLDPEISRILYKIPDNKKANVEEIRIRNQKPLMILGEGKDYYVSSEGQLLKDEQEGFVVKVCLLYTSDAADE